MHWTSRGTMRFSRLYTSGLYLLAATTTMTHAAPCSVELTHAYDARHFRIPSGRDA
jgi:hypothetical protein